MSKLSDFSIESEDVVLLTFEDGETQRAARGNLSHFLTKEELQRVRRAFKTRKRFLDQYLPPWARVVVLAGLVLMFGVGGMKAYRELIEPAAAPAPQVKSSTSTAAPVDGRSADMSSGNAVQSGDSGSVASTPASPAEATPEMATTMSTPQGPVSTPAGAFSTPTVPGAIKLPVAVPNADDLLAPVEEATKPVTDLLHKAL